MALALATPGLSPSSRCVLARMALVAQDDDNPPTYWGGWPMLATHGLGYETYTRAAEKAVERAVRELQDRGVIKVIRPGGRNRNTEYAVTIPWR